jgi:hypothetical protein
MPGSQATTLTPLTVGTTDSGDFSSWLGRPVQVNEETYVMVQANVAIASGSNGKQLVTALSSGQATWSVSLATGLADQACCGAIPWTLTGPIASGAYFLALRDSYNHVLLTRATLTGTLELGSELVTGTGAELINVLTSYTAPVTGLLATSSGIGLVLGQLRHKAAVNLEADATTAVVAVSHTVRYHAPFRGAD